MNSKQAGRLLDTGFDLVNHYDNRGAQASSWQRNAHLSALPAWAVQQAAVQATWGQSAGDAIARQVAIQEFASILTILVPVPGGGFIIAAVENWLAGQGAQELADRLERAVQKEFGPNWAPVITVGIGAVALFFVAITRRSA